MRDLTFRYRGEERVVIDGASFEVPAGMCTALVGPNGAGKSTLLRLLLGLERPERGTVKFAGRSVAAWPRRAFARAVGVVPQGESMAFPLTAREVVAMGRYPHVGAWRRERPEDARAVEQAMRACDVHELAEGQVDRLSGGEQQRIRLARALAQSPGALALDEPTTMLDVRHEMMIFELLRAAAAAGTTVLVVTHELNLAARYAKHLVLLDAGRVVAAGSPAEVLTRARAERVFAWPITIVPHPGPGPDCGAPQLVPLASACRRVLVYLIAGLLALGFTHAALAQFPAEVAGRVVVRGTALVVPGAIVDVPGRDVRGVTDADGRFTLRGVEPGEIALRVRAVGYRPATLRVQAVNGRTATVVVELALNAAQLAPVEVLGARAPAGALVIDRAVIATSGARDVGELLAGAAGLVITRRGGPGAPVSISIRGSSDAEVLVLVDGEPINDAITGAADLSTLVPATIERITVLRGTQSARYGPRALGGVVLIELREPTRVEGSARAEAGAWGERSASASVGARRPLDARAPTAVSGLVSGEWRTTDGTFPVDVPAVRGGGEIVRRNAAARRASLVSTIALDRAAEALRLRVDVTDATRGMPGPIAQPSPSAHQAERRIGAVAMGRAKRGAWSVRGEVITQWERVRFRDVAPPVGPPYDDSVRATSFGGTATVERSFAAGELMAGVDARRLRVDANVLTDSAPPVQRLAGAWLMARVARPVRLLGDSSVRFEFTTEGRVDGSSMMRGAVVSPRAGVALTRRADGPGSVRVHVSWGRAFSPPSLADQFFHEGVLTRANPALRPEQVQGELEVGVGLEHARIRDVELGADLTLYRADIDGLIQWLPDFRFVWSPSNIDAHRRGWETTVHASITPLHATLTGSVSRTLIEYAGPVLSGQVVYRPRTTASMQAQATVAGVRATLVTRWTGVRRTVPGSALNALPAFAQSDLRFAHDIPAGAWAIGTTLAVENVFDSRTEMLIDYPAPGRTWRVMLSFVRRADRDDTDRARPSR